MEGLGFLEHAILSRQPLAKVWSASPLCSSDPRSPFGHPAHLPASWAHTSYRPPSLLCAHPLPFPPPLDTSSLGTTGALSLRTWKQRVLGNRGVDQKARPGLWGQSWALGGVGPSPHAQQGRSGALTGPSPADLKNHQHAGALARGRAGLQRLPGARVQDPRLPLVSEAGRAHRWVSCFVSD